jgi:hypothetical protein
MSDLNFSEKELENTDEGKNNGGEQAGSDKPTKIVFDYDQLDYIKFRLTFGDGFMFGLGVIIAGILVFGIIFMFLMIAGFSLSNLILKELMSLY